MKRLLQNVVEETKKKHVQTLFTLCFMDECMESMCSVTFHTINYYSEMFEQLLEESKSNRAIKVFSLSSRVQVK